MIDATHRGRLLGAGHGRGMENGCVPRYDAFVPHPSRCTLGGVVEAFGAGNAGDEVGNERMVNDGRIEHG